jgi:hypothetical protein
MVRFVKFGEEFGKTVAFLKQNKYNKGKKLHVVRVHILIEL